MIQLPRSESDDPGFMHQIEWIVRGCLAEYRPAEFYATRIRDWFDYKWCYFSGKALGAIGAAKWTDMTLPPFVPNRVLSQSHYARVSPELEIYEQSDAPPLHVHQRSAANFQRFVRRRTDDGTLFWLSSGSATSGRGSIMVYHVTPDLKFGWHVTLMKKTEWQIEKVTFTSRPVLEALRESGRVQMLAEHEPSVDRYTRPAIRRQGATQSEH